MTQPIPSITVAGNVEGSIVVGDHNFVVNTNHGTIIHQQAAPRVKLRDAAPQPPRAPRWFVGRAQELAQLEQLIARREAAIIVGAEGVGKTTLLKRAAHGAAARALPNGVVFLEGVDEAGAALGLNDLIQRLFDALYESEPQLKVNTASARTYLSNTHPLVLLDQLSLPASALSTLPDLFPQAALLMTSIQPPADEAAQPVKLGPLPRAEAMELLAAKAGLSLDDADRAVVDELCALLADVPLALVTAANAIREKDVPLDRARQILAAIKPPSTNPTQAAIERAYTLAYSSLSSEERQMLALAAGQPGISVDRAWLESAAGGAAASETLEKLDLLQANSPRLRVPPGLRAVALSGVNEAVARERQLAHLRAALAEGAPSRALDFEFIAEELGNILGLLGWAVREGRWADAIALGRAVDPYLTLRGLWDAWRAVLDQIMVAATASGDRATEAWAFHQLGTRELGLGQAGGARSFLQQALELRRELGDAVGMAYTQHNLNFLVPPPPPSTPQQPLTPAGPGALVLGGVAGVLIALAVAVVAVAGFVGLTLFNGRATPTPVPQVAVPPTATATAAIVQPATPETATNPTSTAPAPPSLTPPHTSTPTPTTAPTVTPLPLPAWLLPFFSDRNRNFEIFILNANGSELNQLTKSAGDDHTSPVLSPDGKHIFFTAIDPNFNATQYLMSADGSGLINLSANFQFVSDLAWKPDGSQIAFTGDGVIYVMNTDGSGLTPIVRDGAHPVWSPDGSQLAFVSSGFLLVANSDGSGLLRVAEQALEPVWSPEGQRLAYSSLSGQGETLEVAVVGAAAAGPLPILQTEGFLQGYRWTADGRQLLVTLHDPGGGAELLALNADGSGQVTLAKGGDSGACGPFPLYDPVLAPDGRQVAFAADLSGRPEIYVVQPDGSGLKQLTTSGPNYYPIWSPDGARIAYQSYADDNAEIYVMNADGSGQTNLTQNPAKDLLAGEGGCACPFVFTYDAEQEAWRQDTTILYKLVGKERETLQPRALSRFDGRLLIRELEPEVSYIDQLFVRVLDAEGQLIELPAQLPALRAADGDYVVLNMGDEMMLTFEGYETIRAPQQVWVVARGYYVPLRGQLGN